MLYSQSEEDRKTDEMIRENNRPITLEEKIKALAWFYGIGLLLVWLIVKMTLWLTHTLFNWP